MKKRCLVTTVLLLLPAAAGAEQLEYGVRSGLGWTNNVFSTADNATVTVTNNNGVQVRDEKKVDDFSVRLSPWGRVSDPDGDLTWSLRYQPSYEYYFQESSLRGFDQDANGDISWRVGERTTLFATEAFQQYRSLVRFNENSASPTDPAALHGKRDEILSNIITVGTRHFFTPRDIWMVSGSYNFRDYSDKASQDRWSTTLGTSYEHNLTERTVIGARGAWTQQTFARQLGSDTVTNYYNISGTIEHHFSRTLSLEIAAGPALIDGNDQVVSFSPKFGATTVNIGGGSATVGIDANACPLQNSLLPHQPDPDQPNYNPHVSALGFGSCGVNSVNTLTPGELDLLGYPTGGNPLVPGGSGVPQGTKVTDFSHPYREDASGGLVAFDDSGTGTTDLTYFARVALIKDWELWHVELAYDRSNDDSGSFGTSSVQDSFEATVRWQPAQLWSIELLGAYSMIDQASDIAVPTGLILENGPTPAGVDTMPQIATVQRLVVKSESNAVSYTTASVSLTATRRLSYHSSVFGALYWYQQDQNLDLPSEFSTVPIKTAGVTDHNTWSTLTLWIGLDWQFDTLKF